MNGTITVIVTLIFRDDFSIAWSVEWLIQLHINITSSLCKYCFSPKCTQSFFSTHSAPFFIIIHILFLFLSSCIKFYVPYFQRHLVCCVVSGVVGDLKWRYLFYWGMVTGNRREESVWPFLLIPFTWQRLISC